MLLRSFCLFFGLIFCCTSVGAASLPLTPQVLSSQLRIDRHEMTISTEDWHWLRHKGELRVGVSAGESAPFSVTPEGYPYEGISADVTALVAQLLGLQTKVETFASEQDAREALQTGRVDMISTHRSSALPPDLLLSMPYATDRLAVFKRSAERRHSPSDLAGLRVAITAEHSAELKQHYPRAMLQVYPDHDKAIAAAAFGQADVYLDDLYSAYYLINRSFYSLVRFEHFAKVRGGATAMPCRLTIRDCSGSSTPLSKPLAKINYAIWPSAGLATASSRVKLPSALALSKNVGSSGIRWLGW